MNSKLIYLLLVFGVLINAQAAWSQQKVPADTTKKVEILLAKKLEFLKINDSTEL